MNAPIVPTPPQKNNVYVIQTYDYATDLTRPTELWVFLDEHPDSVNDGTFIGTTLTIARCLAGWRFARTQ